MWTWRLKLISIIVIAYPGVLVALIFLTQGYPLPTWALVLFALGCGSNIPLQLIWWKRLEMHLNRRRPGGLIPEQGGR